MGVLVKQRYFRGALLVAVGSMCLLLGGRSVAGSGDEQSMYAARAKLGVAFALNFIRWSSLRQESDEAVALCVDCAVPIDELQGIVEGKVVGNASVRLVEGGAEGKGSTCRAVLYCEGRFPKDSTKVRAVGKSGVLVIGFSGAIERGGMIELYTNSADKVRFRIDIDRLAEAKIKMESRVLDLADR